MNHGKQYLFSGRVQGVGFRWTTFHLVKNYKVCGIVENLNDGRVNLILEGDASEIEACILALKKEMKDFITSVESSDVPMEEFEEFTIRT